MGSIRNRISALRVKQRNMYEEHGWGLPEGGASHSTKKPKATPSKRGAGTGDGAEAETPTKKARTARRKKPATPEKDSGGEDDEEVGDEIVKEEEIDEV